MSKENPDWSKAPEGATHYDPAGVIVNWFDMNRDVFYSSIDQEWFDTCEKREALMKRLIPRPTTWSGEGLPPVGEVIDSQISDTGENNARIKVTYSSRDVVCGEVISGDASYIPGKVIACETSIYEFRPIPRTITISGMDRNSDEWRGIEALIKASGGEVE